jgi:hypothetical protein
VTTSTMSRGMHAHLRAQVSRILNETDVIFARQIARQNTLPMPTLSNTTKFQITTVHDGAREWTFTISLAEQASPDGTPTTDHDINARGT